MSEMETIPDITNCKNGPGCTCWELMCPPCSEEINNIIRENTRMRKWIRHRSGQINNLSIKNHGITIEIEALKEKIEKIKAEGQDWIDRITSENEELREEVKVLRACYSEHLNGVTVWDWKRRTEKAEAEVERLRGVLRRINSHETDFGRPQSWPAQEAREALEGKK